MPVTRERVAPACEDLPLDFRKRGHQFRLLDHPLLVLPDRFISGTDLELRDGVVQVAERVAPLRWTTDVQVVRLTAPLVDDHGFLHAFLWLRGTLTGAKPTLRCERANLRPLGP